MDSHCTARKAHSGQLLSIKLLVGENVANGCRNESLGASQLLCFLLLWNSVEVPKTCGICCSDKAQVSRGLGSGEVRSQAQVRSESTGEGKQG